MMQVLTDVGWGVGITVAFLTIYTLIGCLGYVLLCDDLLEKEYIDNDLPGMYFAFWPVLLLWVLFNWPIRSIHKGITNFFDWVEKKRIEKMVRRKVEEARKYAYKIPPPIPSVMKDLEDKPMPGYRDSICVNCGKSPH